MSQAEQRVASGDQAEADARQRWATPPAAVYNLERLLDVRVALDVCAEPWSAKASRWYGPVEDGLTSPWDVGPLQAWFCNPPFAYIDPWVDRALRVSTPGLLWLPPRTDRPWWHRLLVAGEARPIYIEGRIPHELPPELVQVYAGKGKRRTGPGGGIVVWAIRIETELVRLTKAELLRQPELPGLGAAA